MTITVVAPDDCIAAVATVPMPTPTSLLFDVRAKSCLSLLELTDSRFELIIVQAIRNIPMPAMRDKTAVAIWTGVILIVFARPYVREERMLHRLVPVSSYNPNYHLISIIR